MKIKTAVRLENNVVMVFDKRGEQIPEYQGQYQEVRGSILRNALTETMLAHGDTQAGNLREVPGEE